VDDTCKIESHVVFSHCRPFVPFSTEEILPSSCCHVVVKNVLAFANRRRMGSSWRCLKSQNKLMAKKAKGKNGRRTGVNWKLEPTLVRRPSLLSPHLQLDILYSKKRRWRTCCTVVLVLVLVCQDAVAQSYRRQRGKVWACRNQLKLCDDHTPASCHVSIPIITFSAFLLRLRRPQSRRT